MGIATYNGSPGQWLDLPCRQIATINYSYARRYMEALLSRKLCTFYRIVRGHVAALWSRVHKSCAAANQFYLAHIARDLCDAVQRKPSKRVPSAMFVTDFQSHENLHQRSRVAPANSLLQFQRDRLNIGRRLIYLRWGKCVCTQVMVAKKTYQGSTLCGCWETLKISVFASNPVWD